MRKLFIALLFILLGFFSNCSAASTNNRVVNPARGDPPAGWMCPRRTIRVGFDSHLSQRHQELGALALSNFEAFNIHAIAVYRTPDVYVRPWNTTNCDNHYIGLHTFYTNYVRVVPNCIVSEQQFQAVVVHEIGHWLGLLHVCEEDGRTTDSCSPVGRGSAVMNPYLNWNHITYPSALDIRELNRVCWQQQ